MKKHIVDVCTIHASVVRILLQTMFVNTSVVSSILQTRILYTRLQYFPYHRRVQATDAPVAQTRLYPTAQPTQHRYTQITQIYIHRSHRYIHRYIYTQTYIYTDHSCSSQNLICSSHTSQIVYHTQLIDCSSPGNSHVSPIVSHSSKLMSIAAASQDR